MTRNRRLLILVGPAVALAVALILVWALGRGGNSTNTTKRVTQSRVNTMLAGIPQSGIVLGKASAPVTLVEFVDLQCPYCGEWSRGTFPAVVEKYVRAGKVKIEFRGMHFLGPDSDTALRAVLAAGRQGKLWNMSEGLFERQGTENTGWVTEDLLRQVGDSISGFDTQRMLTDRDSKAVDAAIKQTEEITNAIGVRSTPTFYAGRKGKQLTQVKLTSLGPSGIEPTLDKLLAG